MFGAPTSSGGPDTASPPGDHAGGRAGTSRLDAARRRLAMSLLYLLATGGVWWLRGFHSSWPVTVVVALNVVNALVAAVQWRRASASGPSSDRLGAEASLSASPTAEASIAEPAGRRLGTTVIWLLGGASMVVVAITALALVYRTRPLTEVTEVTGAAWAGAGTVDNSPAISSVRAQVVASSAPPTLTLENLRDVPLEAWQIDVFARQGDETPVYTELVDACCLQVVDAATPIAPHEVRRLAFPRMRATPSFAATVSVVVFADGSFEGSSADRERLLARRDRTASMAGYWIDAIHEALRHQGSDGPVVLSDRLGATSVGPAATGQTLRVAMAALLDASRQGHDHFADAARRELELLERQRTAILEHLPPAN